MLAAFPIICGILGGDVVLTGEHARRFDKVNPVTGSLGYKARDLLYLAPSSAKRYRDIYLRIVESFLCTVVVEIRFSQNQSPTVERQTRTRCSHEKFVTLGQPNLQSLAFKSLQFLDKPPVTVKQTIYRTRRHEVADFPGNVNALT